jgi:hypothetical protein
MIRQLHIENFKSIEKLTLDLGRIRLRSKNGRERIDTGILGRFPQKREGQEGSTPPRWLRFAAARASSR